MSRQQQQRNRRRRTRGREEGGQNHGGQNHPGGFGFPQFFQNFRQSFDNIVHDFSNIAEGAARRTPTPHQHHHHQQQPQQQQPQQNPFSSQPAPPASARAIRQLPTIRVAPEDLVDPNNRECCICLEENKLGDMVTRLPCAHIFHTECIVDWLKNHHCTCPVCRYELQTDFPLYEAGRLQRMKTRKPRFAMYELQRLSVPQLLELYQSVSSSSRRAKKAPPPGTNKRELIQLLIDEEKIDIIPAPEPVEYALSELRGMKISQLKRTMADAGVFFRPQDVVEKSDMITVFLNSGRLNLTPEVEDEEEDDYEEEGEEEEEGDEQLQQATTFPQKRPYVETVNSDDEEGRAATRANTKPTTNGTERPGAAEVLFGSQADELASREEHLEPATVPAYEGNETVKNHVPTTPAASATDSTPKDTTDTPPNGLKEAATPMSMDSPSPTISSAPMDIEASDASGTGTSSPGVSAAATSPSIENRNNSCNFKSCSIVELQAIARAANIDLSSCFERREMIDLLKEAGITSPNSTTTHNNYLENWSVSQLRALAREVNIDLSRCSTKSEMMECILEQANERTRLKHYLLALVPLAKSSISELRATAREWNVNISDCLEKEEILTRLISKAGTFGVA